MRLLLSLIVCVFAAPAFAQPLLRAHAHNDYEHPRPLLDALDHGFISVEADIHLVDGALLVAHDLEDVVPERTLEALYLAPLRAHIRVHSGRVYPTQQPFILLIDIKSDAEATYAALRPLLRRYADIMTVFTPTTMDPGPVMAILSGSRPRTTLASEPIRYAAFDGRLSDLGQDVPVAFMPLVSDNWLRFGAWYGRGPMPDSTSAKLANVIAQTHAEGRLLRFWATTDSPTVWQALYDAGVDLLNADDLGALRTFLRAQR